MTLFLFSLDLMQIQKILLSFKSGLITPIESDTLLSYIFAMDFAYNEPIFRLFQSKETVPFVFSNAMLPGLLPRPLFFPSKEKKEIWITEALHSELERKKTKSASMIQMQASAFSDFFAGLQTQNMLQEPEITSIAEFKNTVPRFAQADTTPYSIPQVHYTDQDWVVYVKIYDQKAFQRFFASMQTVLMQYGFWAGKSRGYGKLSACTLQESTPSEKAVFDEIDQLRKQGLVYLINNFKPSSLEIQQIDWSKSYYQLHTKQAKKADGEIFKGALNFLAAGSVLSWKISDDPNTRYGDFYQTNQAFNFWYLF